MRILDLEKLSHSQEATTVTTRGSLRLMELGLTRWPASWDSAALAAEIDGKVVGTLVYREDDSDLSIVVTMAAVDAGHPLVLARLLGRLRSKYRATKFQDIYFTHHLGNPAMAKAVKAVRAEVFTQTCRVRLGGPK